MKHAFKSGNDDLFKNKMEMMTYLNMKWERKKRNKGKITLKRLKIPMAGNYLGTGELR
jgi:hypothetical protein